MAPCDAEKFGSEKGVLARYTMHSNALLTVDWFLLNILSLGSSTRKLEIKVVNGCTRLYDVLPSPLTRQYAF